MENVSVFVSIKNINSNTSTHKRKQYMIYEFACPCCPNTSRALTAQAIVTCLPFRKHPITLYKTRTLLSLKFMTSNNIPIVIQIQIIQ